MKAGWLLNYSGIITIKLVRKECMKSIILMFGWWEYLFIHPTDYVNHIYSHVILAVTQQTLHCYYYFKE